MNDKPHTNVSLRGLVLAGGQSRRMGRDKAALRYGTEPQWLRTANLLSGFCKDVCISIRPGQELPDYPPRLDNLAHSMTLIPDQITDAGPLAGLLSAYRTESQSAWLVVACDLPLLGESTLNFLVTHRNTADWATAFRSAHDGLPEPLCAIYEPAIAPILEERYAAGSLCPRKILRQSAGSVTLLDLPVPESLDNANTPEDFQRLAALAHPDIST